MDKTTTLPIWVLVVILVIGFCLGALANATQSEKRLKNINDNIAVYVDYQAKLRTALDINTTAVAAIAAKKAALEGGKNGLANR